MRNYPDDLPPPSRGFDEVCCENEDCERWGKYFYIYGEVDLGIFTPDDESEYECEECGEICE